jgi:orotate phosphoribosyltransferase
VVDAFARCLVRLCDKEHISCLGFIEKIAGPVGALSMIPELVRELKLPACIYRADHWPTRATLAGYQLRPTDRIALVYDLIVTGDGIRQAAEDLKAKFGATVVAAVVLFGYGEKRDKLDNVNGQTIPLEAIGWYNDFAAQIQKVQADKVVQTTNITTLSSGRRNSRSPAAGGGTGDSPPSHGGKRMDHTPRWSRSIDSYPNEELRAVQFRTAKDVYRVIDLTWSDPDLKDVPHDIVGRRTLLFPIEAIDLLRAKGLKFKISNVVGPSDIPSEKLIEMRRKHGM